MTIASPVPAYVPEDWTPAKMTRRDYDTRRAHLVEQRDAMRIVVATYRIAFDTAAAHPTLGLDDTVSAAWNAAHDAETALEHAIDALDREWDLRNVDPYQRFLVANNCD